ncbi:craniofacial development protein 2 [Biomphalaria glabrata]|nr:craniofacial development protein 2-like [Biomphalaria glabrata]
MTKPDDVIAKFYEELNFTLLDIPKTEKLLILGDFNARVGSDHHIWKGVLGGFGIVQCISNGLLLLQTCAEHKLLISNTIFSLPMRKRTSWMHPLSTLAPHRLVITRQSDRQDICVTKSSCGAECGTDYRLIITKLNIRIQPKSRSQKSKPLKRLNMARLAADKIEKSLADAIEYCLKSTHLVESSVDNSWECFKEVIHSTALNILGPKERKHQDWFDENST